jgi:uncharacterized protein YxeA
MKKLLFILVLIPLLAGCSVRERSFDQFYKGDPASVTYLIMQNGKTGEMRKITDKNAIDAFFDLLYTLKFAMQKNQMPRADYAYRVDVYDNNGQVMRLTFTPDTARVNNVYYFLDLNVRKELEQIFASGTETHSN